MGGRCRLELGGLGGVLLLKFMEQADMQESLGVWVLFKEDDL